MYGVACLEEWDIFCVSESDQGLELLQDKLTSLKPCAATPQAFQVHELPKLVQNKSPKQHDKVCSARGSSGFPLS